MNYNAEFLIWLMLFSLAGFRLTYMISKETLPFYLGIRIRNLFGIKYYNYQENRYLTVKEVIERHRTNTLEGEVINTKHISELISCFWCFSIWTSLILLVLYIQFPVFTNYLFIVLGISTLQIIIKEKF